MSKSYTKDGTKWTPTTGKVFKSEPGYGPIIKAMGDDGGIYIFSQKDPKVELPVGTRISFDYGHPGEHRGVAINVKAINE